jgi:pimeloyl-ACP methyl ester carboxylesterase
MEIRSFVKGLLARPQVAQAPAPAPAPAPDELATDGELRQLRSRTPDRSGRPPVLYVNGMLTDMEKSSAQGQRLADQLGRDVTLVHNATALGNQRDLKGLARAAGRDTAQVVADQAGVGHNPAVDSLKELISQRLDQDRQPIELVGYSQGAQISARALREVRQERVQAAMQRGTSRDQAEQLVDKELADRVDFLNMSGAAQRSDFPAALQHYRQISIQGDPVSQLLGEQSGGYQRSEFARRGAKLPALMLQNLARHNFANVLDAPENRQTLLDFKM